MKSYGTLAYAFFTFVAVWLSVACMSSASWLRFDLARLDTRVSRLEADTRLLMESRLQEGRYLDRLESRISPPVVEGYIPDGYLLERRGDKYVQVPISDSAEEARIEQSLPRSKPDGYDSLLEKLGRTMDRVRILEEALDSRIERLPSPSPTPAPPEPMIGPAGSGRTRQEVLDSIPKGDPLYNFRSIEWDALSLPDTEWSETYGTSPEIREGSRKGISGNPPRSTSEPLAQPEALYR